jgi:acid stress-induced BolA-like protein IbaG/YrbA
MATIEQKVKELLQLQFREDEIQFDHEAGERISGFIVSEKFEGLDSEARHEMIWRDLRANLTSEERRQVLGFLAFTPAEDKVYEEAF